MRPKFTPRTNEQLSLQAEMAVAAGGDALAAAGRAASGVDAVICAASNMQRPYPAMAIEIQRALGISQGYGFDMNVACSSATFALELAVNAVRCDTARTVLVVNPEICSAHLAWQDRDCHFMEPETEALPSPPVSDAQDTPKGTISIGVSAGNNAPPGVIFSVRSSEVRDGEAVSVVTENQMVYRYSDGFMFESTSDGLKTAELPAGDSLRQLENADVFSEFAFYADRVPPGIKQLGWGMISAGMGTDLQQRDEEPDTEYETRRALGDAQLILLQSMIFDLQKVSGWVRMASEVEPLEAQLRVATRENSDLAKRLRELSSSASYFGPILNDDAIVTFHVCLMVPEHWRKFLKAAVSDLRRSEAG